MKNEPRILKLGAVDFISKPINPTVIETRIHTHLQLKLRQIESDKLADLLTKQLIHAQRIATIGNQATCAAHEIYNQLFYIMGNIEMLDKDLIRMNTLFEKETKNSSDVKKNIAPHLPHCFGNAHQLEQVFVNLINNAIDAMKSQPIKELEFTAFFQIEAIFIFIEDTGPGIIGEDLNKIWQPFFTTTKRGERTGLGLSLCKSIIKNHKGEIWVEQYCRGSKFVIKLSAVDMQTKTSQEKT